MVYIYSDINNLLTCITYICDGLFGLYLQITVTRPKSFFLIVLRFLSLIWVTIILRQVMDSRYSKSFNYRNSELDNLYQS